MPAAAARALVATLCASSLAATGAGSNRPSRSRASGIRRAGAATARRAAIDNRHLLEGPDVRDRIVHGAQVGLPDASVVVVASRLKEGWGVGAVVLSDRGVFRILEVEDRTIAGRLRCLYSLTPHEDLEVLRRAVQYQFPTRDSDESEPESA